MRSGRDGKGDARRAPGSTATSPVRRLDPSAGSLLDEEDVIDAGAAFPVPPAVHGGDIDPNLGGELAVGDLGGAQVASERRGHGEIMCQAAQFVKNGRAPTPSKSPETERVTTKIVEDKEAEDRVRAHIRQLMREAKEGAGLNQTEFAAIIGIDRSEVSKILGEVRHAIRLGYLLRICRAFHPMDMNILMLKDPPRVYFNKGSELPPGASRRGRRGQKS